MTPPEPGPWTERLRALFWKAAETRFVRDAGMLAGAQLFVAGLAFIQGLVVAAILGPEQYGVALLIISVPTMLFSFLDARTSAAAVKFLSQFRSEGSPERARAMTKLAYSVDMVIAVLTLLLVAFASPWAETHIVHQPDVATLMIAYAAAFVPKSLAGTSQSVLSVFGRFRAVALAQLFCKMVGVAAVLGLVLSGWGVHGVIYGRMAELIVTGLLLAVLAGSSVRRSWGGSWIGGRLGALRGHLREIFRFLGFTELTELVNVLSKQADMVILGYFAGAEEAGYFGLAKRMTGIVTMVVLPLQSVLYPRLAKTWADADFVALRRTIRRYAFGISVPIGALVLLSVPLVWPFIHYVVGSEWDPAVPVAQIILASSAFWLAASWLRPLFHAMGAVRFLLITATIANALSLLGFLVAAPLAGAVGLAWVHLLIGGLLGQGIGLVYARRRLRQTRAADRTLPDPAAETVRILFVNYRALPSLGGKQTYTDRLVRGLVEEGAEVTVIATATPKPDTPLDAPYRTIYEPGPVALWRCLERADVVHFNAFVWMPWIFAYLQAKPIVFVYHETADRLCARAMGWRWWERRCRYHPSVPCLWCGQTSPFRSTRHWLQKPIQQRVTERADVIVSPVRWWLDRLPARTRHVPHGIDRDFFSPAVAPTRDFLLFIGRLVDDKGPSLLLEALALCAARGQHPRLVLVGEGPRRADLEAQARSLGLEDQVEFLGRVSDEETVRCYQNAIATVVPSVWEEMFGLVAAESMACRTPVIAAALGGLNETAGEAGLVFPPGDARALAGRLLQLLEDEALARRLAEEGDRLVALHHDHRVMVRSYLALYRELVASPSPRPSPEAASPR